MDLKSFVLAFTLAYCAAVTGSYAADITTPDPKWPDSTQGCAVLNTPTRFSAGYYDPKTYAMKEKVSITEGADPVVERTTSERGLIRKHCEPMVLHVLGAARARLLMRLTD